ncbi:trypsin-like peptidase domain-containing protein [SAR86 cluster bacterium]|jgi:S1-C subfamily serine protease|uniref:Trypsin-like peptidase domain-containing protein n=1 Tax=SAR86 cluster bacterium TaxID=2030880 RepID=A0A9Q8X2P6_9GAMM|nr:trypsin-like peptidase domain-containing protein [SAR86 cluster bacterium]
MRYFFLTILFLGLFVGVQVVLYQNYDSNKSQIDFDNVSSSIVKLETITARSSKNFGSGIIISQDGYIVTAYHLLRGAYNITVNILGDRYDASIVGFDEYSDIAVIKVNATELKPIQIETKLDLEIGDQVYAIGNPFNVGISVSSGILSATGRNFGNPYLDILQTDASINRGNSGGALVNSKGRLVGINTSIATLSGGSDGVGFAIPSDKILSISEEIIKYGEVKRAWIGSFSFRPFIYTDSDNFSQRALLVISNKSETYENGLLNGDIIISIKDSEAIWSTLKASINSITPGDSLELEIIRDGQKQRVLIETTEVPAKLLVP